MTVAVVSTGPGVSWPMATASKSCCCVSQPSSLTSPPWM